ncbi:MAG TPA: hypothetical protein VE010_06775 [Thermoanaerobaculia bacterium]|nr:hypothetical protein [Thermoanaerobaculia bacterium]
MRRGWSAAQRASAAGVGTVVAVWLLTTCLWLTPGITRPDGAGYFAYLPSTFFDRDLLFFDEWEAVRLIRGNNIAFKDVTATGHLSNHWTAGSSLAWYPAFAAAHLIARGDGFQVLYVAAVACTSALAGLFVLLAGLRLANVLFPGRAGTVAAVAIWLGSPLAFYSLRHATMSHAISAAACAAVVLLSLRLRVQERQSCLAPFDRDRKRQARLSLLHFLAVGMAVGYACATRPQNITIALVPLLIAPSSLKRAHLMFGGALIAALPQLIVSQTLWGAPLAFVNIGGRAHPWQMFATFRPFETLFSWYHGLATWTPLLLVATVGLFFVARRDRALARAGLVTFIAQWLLLSLLERWFWGGASFGQRRFDSCTIFFIIGLAAFLAQTPRWLGALLTVVPAAWTLMLFISSSRLNLNRYQAPAELLDAFTTAVQQPQWRTLFGYAPPQFRADIAIGALIAAIVFAVIAMAARRRGTVLALAYFFAMSAFFAWCGAHPKHDARTRALIAAPRPSGSARDTIALLRYEAEYMKRTGRPAEGRKALEEAAAIRP